MTAYLLGQDLDLATVTVTGTGFTASGPFAKGVDGRLSTKAVLDTSSSTATINLDFGSGNTLTANAIGLAGHNVVTVQLQGSDDGSSYTNVAEGGFMAGGTHLFAASSATHRYWRINLINGTGSHEFAHLSIGEAITGKPIGDGFAPLLFKHYKTMNKLNRNGEYLGSVARRVPQSVRFKQQGISEAEMRSTWAPFLEYASRRPFFFVPQYENYPNEAAFCWSEDAQNAAYRGLCKMAVDFNVKGVGG
jgi:hypothetical protein